MDIRTAMSRIVAIQTSLSITDPVVSSVLKAWTYVPPESSAAPDVPCFINSWTLVEELRGAGLREQHYQVRMQLLVDPTDEDIASDIATSYMVAIIDAFDADTQLKIAGVPSVSYASLRGASPTLVSLERAGRHYLGLDLFMDLNLKEGKTFG